MLWPSQETRGFQMSLGLLDGHKEIGPRCLEQWGVGRRQQPRVGQEYLFWGHLPPTSGTHTFGRRNNSGAGRSSLPRLFLDGGVIHVNERIIVCSLLPP